MKNKINVVIPAAGKGSRFSEAGWKKPKPFIDVNGISMLEHVIKNIKPHEGEINLILNKEHIISNKDISSHLSTLSNVHIVNQTTEGTACTVLMTRASIDNDSPLLIANSDQLVSFDVDNFIKDCKDRDLDGSILVFKDEEMNEKWSFAKLDEHNLVVEVAEKKPISNLATVGVYFFTRGGDFVDAAIDMIVRNDRVNNEFYTCPVYNYMIDNGLKIGVYEIKNSDMHGLGTPEDLKKYLNFINAPKSADSP